MYKTTKKILFVIVFFLLIFSIIAYVSKVMFEPDDPWYYRFLDRCTRLGDGGYQDDDGNPIPMCGSDSACSKKLVGSSCVVNGIEGDCGKVKKCAETGPFYFGDIYKCVCEKDKSKITDNPPPSDEIG